MPIYNIEGKKLTPIKQVKFKNEREYKLFEGILSRCYSANNDSYDDYGEKNVVVDERWHCFENFLNDIKQLPRMENGA